MKENSALDERFESYEDAAGKHRFRLKAANHQIIGVGARARAHVPTYTYYDLVVSVRDKYLHE